MRRRTVGLGAGVAAVATVAAGTAWALDGKGDEEWRGVVGRPARTRGEALERLKGMQALDGEEIARGSGTRLIEPVGRGGDLAGMAVVLFHGLGSAPPQFAPLAERLVGRGATALLPRLPRHGLRERMTTELMALSAGELVRAASETVDIAAGLGERVVVTGLSLGGVLAVWAAHYRDVERAVPIAPVIGFPPVPLALARRAFELGERLPNQFLWWDGELKERVAGPTYAYPRFATHALARAQRLGFELLDEAQVRAPRAREAWLVTNALDRAVDGAASRLLAARWRAAGGNRVRDYEFPASVGVEHDPVDVYQPYARTEQVYPALERIIGEGMAPA